MTLGGLPTRRLAALWAILTLALVLRIVGLGWGVPSPYPGASNPELRSSYAFDEDNILAALTRTNPSRFDIDPGLYHWGTLHFTLTLAGLEGAQAAGYFSQPWRESFREVTAGELERVYIAGRAVSVAIDLLTVYLTFLLGRRLIGSEAGLWAAALIAVAPGHILQAGQIRVDVSAAAFLTLTVFLALARAHPAVVGLAAGLALSAKYSTLFPVAAVLIWSIWPQRADRRRIVWLIAAAAVGCLIGFLSGEPFVLTSPREVAAQVARLVSLSRQIPPEILPSKPLLLIQSLSDMARFSLGAPAFVLAVAGLYRLARSGGREGALFALVTAAGLLALLPQNWSLLRYHLPLLPTFAVAAGAVIVARKPTRLLGLAAVAWAFAISLTIVSARLAPHPANLALGVLRQAAGPGDRVARIMPEFPPLDPAVHPPDPNPLTATLDPDNLPEWVALTSLPIIDYPRRNIALLAERYQVVARFRSRTQTGWLTFGQSGAPQDWKYTSPEVSLYRLR